MYDVRVGISPISQLGEKEQNRADTVQSTKHTHRLEVHRLLGPCCQGCGDCDSHRRLLCAHTKPLPTPVLPLPLHLMVPCNSTARGGTQAAGDPRIFIFITPIATTWVASRGCARTWMEWGRE